MQCVDSSANLPSLCPSSAQLFDCSEIQWNVNGQRIVFDICDGNDKTYCRTAFMISYQCISCVYRLWCPMPEADKWFHENCEW